MLKELYKKLKDKFPNIIVRDTLCWAQLTTIRIGKAFPLIIEIREKKLLPDILEIINTRSGITCSGIPIFVIGNGSNVIGTDINSPNIVLKFNFPEEKRISFVENCVSVTADVSLYKFAMICAKKGLGDLSYLADIPGSIGGSIRMNAGTQRETIAKYLHKIYGIFMSGEEWHASAADLKWGYRTVNIPEDVIILSAEFLLEEVSIGETVEGILKRVSEKRKRFPRYPNAGSVFKNPTAALSAGKIIEEAGCKGMQIGGVRVSSEHANIFINVNNANEQDFRELCRVVREKVYAKFGFLLEEEVRFVFGGVYIQ